MEVVGVKNGQNHPYVINEWPLLDFGFKISRTKEFLTEWDRISEWLVNLCNLEYSYVYLSAQLILYKKRMGQILLCFK